jgi:hypothetical protein
MKEITKELVKQVDSILNWTAEFKKKVAAI